MDFPRSIKSLSSSRRLSFGCLLVSMLLVATGCGPVGSRSQSPFGGGLFNRGNNVAANTTGFAGGFGQSVFGDRSAAGQSGQLFAPSNVIGNNGVGNIAAQQQRFPQPSLNQQAFGQNLLLK